MARKKSGGCLPYLIFGIIYLPFAILGELMKASSGNHRRRGGVMCGWGGRR
jgi:hypothetical protein